MLTSTRMLGRLCLLVVLTLCCGASLARTWTDSAGRTVEGEFVRLNGANVVLKLRGGKIAQVPVGTLSVDDRGHIRQLLEADGIRVWTDLQGRQIEAKFLRTADHKIYVRYNDQTTPLPYDVLSMADCRWVSSRVDESDNDALPPVGDDQQLSPPRFWTSTDGNRAEAQFERMLPDGRVMLAAEHGTELVPVDKLSADDHDFLREQVVLPELAQLIPDRPKPPPIAVANASPAETTTSPKVPENANANAASSRPVAQSPVARPTPAPRHTTPPRQTASNSVRHTSPTPTRQLVCSNCGRTAPPGAKFGAPCTFCNSGEGNSAYAAGKLVGTIIRYGGILALIAFFAGVIWRKLCG